MQGKSTSVKFGILLAASLLVHVVLGWAWTILAGILAGLWIHPRGWLAGMAVVALDWLLLVAWNLAVAGRPVARMLTAVGAIIGNLPGIAIVGVTLLIGALFGLLGGTIGANISALLRHRRAGAAA